MTTGFLVVVVIIFVLIIGSTLWVTNKAYSGKSERIDPLPGKDAIQKELDQ
ncbi:hypothetical protein [Brevibacillus nitrificans]|uniref:hypothetical protein n=1 Tax=Brevibacillus nitrificans TaxID=651560 RepID=UPI0028603DB7|nr:hypothetical protein [Brevibacillus nitrificans]MDR7319072.1 hypothetical protein [Brevibacillus nitrificans]